MKQASDNRRIEFEGVANFRDLGGYETADGRTVRWRQLFRSDALHYMTKRDAVRARDELGIRTVIDLRTLEAIPRSRCSLCPCIRSWYPARSAILPSTVAPSCLPRLSAPLRYPGWWS